MSASGSTQGEPQRAFGCPRCAKSFSRSENLRRHFATHDLVGRHRCPVCQKHFSRSDLLKRHRKNHENDRARSNSEALTVPNNSNAPNTSNPGTKQAGPTSGEQSVTRSEHQFSLSIDDQSSPRSLQFNDSRGEIGLDAAPTNLQGSHFSAVWDGLITYGDGDMSGLNLRSYDGDIAWTLDFAKSHPSVESFPDDMLIVSNGEGLDMSNIPISINQDNPVEVEDDETSEWPDRISRSGSPSQPAPRRTYQSPQYWLKIVAEAEAAKSDFQSHQNYLYASGINSVIRNDLVTLLDLPLSTEASGGELHEGALPPKEILEFFLLLYFRHVHRRFPVIHRATFDPSTTAPVLLLAMLLVGSSHSKLNHGWFTKLFYKRSRIILMRKQEADNKFFRSVENLFALLLVCVAGTWSGGRESYEFAEGVRGVLVTASRRCRLLDCRMNIRATNSYGSGRVLDQMWLSWVETEKRKRLGLAIYLFDCQFPALFNNQPYISKAETANSVFPCASEYWEASTSDAWKMLIGPADIPPSTFYLHALNCCLLRKREPLPSAARTDNFGKVVLIYALHTHIFEWRQAISMLNPNGLGNSYGSFIFAIGDGLRDRRKWLIDSLTNWYECYWTPDIDVGGLLLYHLAFVSLDVSLSDLHLAAGRSGSRGEGEVAERSLALWANSETADETMGHVDKMLELAHAALVAGEAVGSSFEVAMSLFTGGLVCWAYNKHRVHAGQHRRGDQVHKAGRMLREMGCWRMCSLFGVIGE